MSQMIVGFAGSTFPGIVVDSHEAPGGRMFTVDLLAAQVRRDLHLARGLIERQRELLTTPAVCLAPPGVACSCGEGRL